MANWVLVVSDGLKDVMKQCFCVRDAMIKNKEFGECPLVLRSHIQMAPVMQAASVCLEFSMPSIMRKPP